MKRHPMLILALGAVALASTASILAGLRHVLGRREPARKDEGQMTERERVRAALADITMKIDEDNWRRFRRSDIAKPDDWKAYVLSMKRSERPAWHDIREDRDSRE